MKEVCLVISNTAGKIKNAVLIMLDFIYSVILINDVSYELFRSFRRYALNTVSPSELSNTESFSRSWEVSNINKMIVIHF